MYKVFGNQLKCVALGSICTLIGVVFSSMFPFARAVDEVSTFDKVICRQILIESENNEVVAYLGNSKPFENESFLGDSNHALLGFISPGEASGQGMWITNSCLTVSNQGKLIQLGRPTLPIGSTICENGLLIFDETNDVLSVLLGATSDTGNGLLSLGDGDDFTIYPQPDREKSDD